MVRNIGPKCKLCRREGVKLFLKGARCLSDKCPIERKGPVPPGQHGMRRQRKMSDYGVQLREKQKAKRLYGVNERQFSNYHKEAMQSHANTGTRLLQLLESRLDNVIFRGGLVPSRSLARQLVTHGHVLVNAKKLDIASYQVKLADTISLDPKTMGLDLIKTHLVSKDVIVSPWLKRQAAVIKFDRLPEREEIEADINESLIIEFYSR